MKIYLTPLFIFLYLFSNSITYSSELKSEKSDNLIAVMHLDMQDTVFFESKNEESKYIDSSEFYYANTKRFSLTGKLPLKETDINYLNTGLFAGFFTTWFYLQHVGQMETIWDEIGDFHFYEDGKYAMYADKAGHWFGTYYTSYFLKEALILCGFSWDTSTLLGAFLGLSYSTYVEVLDGFGINWGFSPSDFYADLAGFLFFIGQHYWPFLENFTPKFTYIPANWHGDLKRQPSDMFIDDYSSHTLWLSVNVDNLLPEKAADYWPDWLEISFGYAVRNLCCPGCKGINCDPNISEPVDPLVWGNRKFVIALDYNLVKLLPDGPNFLNWLKQSANYLKFPAPAIEFGNETEFYLFYPFQIEINLSK